MIKKIVPLMYSFGLWRNTTQCSFLTDHNTLWLCCLVLVVAGGVGDTPAVSSTVEMLDLDTPAGQSAHQDRATYE